MQFNSPSQMKRGTYFQVEGLVLRAWLFYWQNYFTVADFEDLDVLSRWTR
jgi:hypothetical protein